MTRKALPALYLLSLALLLSAHARAGEDFLSEALASPTLEGPYHCSLGVATGLSTFSSPALSQSTQGAIFGVNAVLIAPRDFSLEADGFGGIASPQQVQLSYQAGAFLVPGTLRLHEFGARVSLNKSFPFRWAGVSIVPKLGVGYGFADVEASVDTSDSTAEAQVSAHAPFARVALEIEPLTSFFLSTEIARSFLASGSSQIRLTAKDAGGLSLDSTREIGSPRLDELRVGARYLIGGSLGAGVIYAHQRFSADDGGGTASSDLFLCSLVYGF